MADEVASGTGTLHDELLNTAPCGFLSFRDDGIVTLVNDTLLKLLGYARDQLVGRHVEAVLTTGSRIFYHTHWFPLLRLHGRAEEIFLLLRDSRGEEVGMLVNSVRHERLGAHAYDCILMRVRERQKYEEELLRARRTAEQARAQVEAQSKELERSQAAAEEANQAKSSFLAVMSHELRTPLNAISGYVELLEMGIHGPVTEAQRDALDRIRRSQRHLLRLINDILNLSRIEAGRVDYHIEEIDVAQVVDEVAPLIEPQLAENGLHFERAVPPGQRVRADREKVQQILLNLLSNAIKFTPRGGRVSVHSRARDAHFVEVAVTDTGIGIPPDRLEAVFEPFVQVDVSARGRKEGTGLGLAISRDLARGMGGELDARSVLGQGSTFTLVLPRASASSEPKA